ncbi:MAG: translation initiation factor IF-2 [Candidatus Edwardsbacteria bacterium]
MDKLRINEAAKEFKLSGEALFKLLKKMGYDVKSPMSVITEEMLAAVHKKFTEEKAALKKELLRKKKHLIKEKKRREKERIRERKRRKRREIKEKKAKIEETVKRTLAKIAKKKPPKPKRKKITVTPEVKELRKIQIMPFASVAELATVLKVEPDEVISKCAELGLVVTINQRLDIDTITAVADEFDYEVEPLKEYGAEVVIEKPKEVLSHRPPVVTVMGHVDHGKTSLLDRVRKTNVVEGEVGGITQHIGAYEVKWQDKVITFLDTPGHEAFTAMRARGAQVTDLVVLVVAANEGVMPQTIEAIDHAKAAGVPLIVAINKIDLPEANPTRVKQELSKQGLMVEEWGGKTIVVEVSARTGKNIDKLLEMILLQAEVLELKADYQKKATGTVIESKMDKGKGALATVLVQQGTLRIGNPFVAGLHYGKVRAMYNEKGEHTNEAGPSSPVLLQGFSGLPQAGDSFQVTEDEREAREISQKRQEIKREQESKPLKRLTLDELYTKISTGEFKSLNLIIKGDVTGSVEVLSDTLYKLSSENLKINVIHKGAGAITESDVLLAEASEAIIIGFHVHPDERAREIAERTEVDIRVYNIIYDVMADVEKALKGLLKPEYKEIIQGQAEVREVFKITGVGTIAGCFINEGTIIRNAKVRLLRDNVVIYEGKVGSLRRFKDDVKEVTTGFECGVSIEKYEDIKKGDTLETYVVEEIHPSR